jgi:hypothetical protein
MGIKPFHFSPFLLTSLWIWGIVILGLKFETKISNPKPKTLHSKQTQIFKAQNSKPDILLSFRFWIYLGFRVW